jgi:hypothetical protein
VKIPQGAFLRIAKVDDEIIMLLHLENLLRLPYDSVQIEWQEGPVRNSVLATERFFCPEATPED